MEKIKIWQHASAVASRWAAAKHPGTPSTTISERRGNVIGSRVFQASLYNPQHGSAPPIGLLQEWRMQKAQNIASVFERAYLRPVQNYTIQKGEPLESVLRKIWGRKKSLLFCLAARLVHELKMDPSIVYLGFGKFISNHGFEGEFSWLKNPDCLVQGNRGPHQNAPLESSPLLHNDKLQPL